MTGKTGRYIIDKLLARGGMAEVFLAHVEGPAGFHKEVVIKRILPQFVEDPRFVRMFLDEAKLAAVLNHPNIVQVFDFGEEAGAYYIAMEYIEGESLRNVIRHFDRREKTVDPYMAAHLLIGACEGLHYAHGLTDRNGASYNVIHRDISPDNILVSTSGITKVVDFGIAKAASNHVRTETGVVKGKYAYMAPELIRGEGVDRGVDVYALGVTLYELVTGQRPFRGLNELGLLQDILKAAPKPAISVNPSVPQALSDICATAMADDRTIRYSDTRVFQSALEDFLAAHSPRIRAVSVSQLVNEVKDERRSLSPGGIESGPKGVPGFAPQGVNVGEQGAPTGLLGRASSTAPTAPTAPATQAPSVPVTMTSGVLTLPTTGSWKVPAALFGGLALVAMALLFTRTPAALEPRIEPPPLVKVEPAPVVKAEPAPVVKVEPAPVVKAVPAPVVKAEPAPVVKAEPGPAVKAEPVKPVVPPVVKPTVVATEGVGSLSVTTEPWCDVVLDGKKLGPTPLVKVAVPAGRHQLVLTNGPIGARRELSVVIKPGEEFKQTAVFQLGHLAIRVEPWASVTIDGVAVGSTPMAPLELAAGPHNVELANSELGRHEKRKVVIRANAEETLRVILE